MMMAKDLKAIIDQFPDNSVVSLGDNWDCNIEEYKSQPFKDATIGDYWYTLDRLTRREIERQVKKGKNPDIMNYV